MRLQTLERIVGAVAVRGTAVVLYFALAVGLAVLIQHQHGVWWSGPIELREATVAKADFDREYRYTVGEEVVITAGDPVTLPDGKVLTIWPEGPCATVKVELPHGAFSLDIHQGLTDFPGDPGMSYGTLKTNWTNATVLVRHCAPGTMTAKIVPARHHTQI